MTWDEAKTRVEGLLRSAERVEQQDTAEALRLLLSHAIPREDRERVVVMFLDVAGNSSAIAVVVPQARHLLKLEAEP